MTPNTSPYGQEQLNLMPRLTRADYRLANNGTQAPPFNPAKPVKRWTTAPGDFSYGYWDLSGVQPQYKRMTFVGSDAAQVNLPGQYEWPPFTPDPSGAFILYPASGEKHYIGVDGLSLYADGVSLIKELIAAGWQCSGAPVESSSGIALSAQYDTTELRRLWIVGINGSGNNVGLLLKMQRSSGFGAPGRWSSPTQSSSPIWYPAIGESGEFSVSPEVPIPQRELLPGEIWRSAFGGTWQIWNTAHAITTSVDNQRAMADNVAAILKSVQGGAVAQLGAATPKDDTIGVQLQDISKGVRAIGVAVNATF